MPASNGRKRLAPFTAVILNLKQGDAAVDGACEKLLSRASAKGVDVLYDDTDQRAGAKFAAADLIGIPWRSWSGPRASPRASSRSNAAATVRGRTSVRPTCGQDRAIGLSPRRICLPLRPYLARIMGLSSNG